MQAAVDWLRKKGLSKAAKKAGRVAAEGLIGIFVTGKKGAMVEVNSETDFVARNDHFQGLVKMIADVALNTGEDIEAIKAAKAGSMTIADAVSSAIATIGENITPRRAAVLSVGQGAIGSYVHNQVSDGLGKIGVLVALESSGNAGELVLLGRQVAMHIASSNPIALDAAGVDPAVVKREKDILADKFRQQGKPEAMIDKITEVGPENLLQGADPARAAVHLRRQEECRAGPEGSRRQGRRSDQGHRLQALRARRGHRKSLVRLRGGGCGGRRNHLTIATRDSRRGPPWPSLPTAG